MARSIAPNSTTALRLARKHLGTSPMESSARLAMADAVRLESEGDLYGAIRRAYQSLAYSVGLFHADCKRVGAMVERLDEMAFSRIQIVA